MDRDRRVVLNVTVVLAVEGDAPAKEIGEAFGRLLQPFPQMHVRQTIFHPTFVGVNTAEDDPGTGG